MNIDAIYEKYTEALAVVAQEKGTIYGQTVALALRLAIQETADANAALVNDMSGIIANLRAQESIPESALVAAQNEAAMLRQQLADARRDFEQLSIGSATEVKELRNQLFQLDADYAILTKRLASANGNAEKVTA